ncbi:MAG TPA: hypothetical protein VKB91_00230, partial [Gemmatimonadaceae bacterium]|nr:hypothetical protein [Gemmatimonadaceae bacterium]
MGSGVFSIMQRQISRYVLLVVVAAVGTAFALYLRDTAFTPAFAQAALTFGLISVLANVLSHKTSGDASGSLSFIPVLASAAIAPHWLTAVVVAGAALVAQVLARRAPLKAVFNVAQEGLSVALAILAYRALGGLPLHSIGESG